MNKLFKILLGVIVGVSLALPIATEAQTKFIVPQGGTGQGTFPVGSILIGNGTNPIQSTVSPSLLNLTVTGSGTSTFAGGINLTTGCFSVGGLCIGNAPSFSTTSANYWLGTKSTTDITEGAKLFYTDARVNSYINGSSTIPKTYTSNTFSQNQILGVGGATPYLQFADSFRMRGNFGNAEVLPSFTSKLFRFLDTTGTSKLDIAFDTGSINSGGVFTFLGTTTNSLSGSLSVTGTSTLGTTITSKLNATFVIDGIKYAKTGAGIKSAVNDAIAAGGGTVYVPGGTYVFGAGSGLAFGGKPIKLIGESATTTIFKASGVGGGIIYDFFSDSTNPNFRSGIEIANITFDLNNQSVISGIQMGSSKDIYIHDTIFRNVLNMWPILIGNIGGTLGSETDTAIATSSSSNINFTQNIIENSDLGTVEGFLCVNCRDSQVTNNTFRNLTQGAAAFAAFGYNRHINITGNIFTNNSIKSVYIQESDYINFSDNQIYYAPTVNAGSMDIVNSTNVTVENNIIQGTESTFGAGGIGVYDNIAGFDGHIQKNQNSSNLIFRNNQFNGTYYGIVIPSQTQADKRMGQSDILIENNTFRNGKWSPIQLGHASSSGMARIRILNNTASSSKEFDTGAITIMGSTTNSSVITDIDIKGNYLSRSSSGGNGSAIYINSASNVRISDNQVAGTAKGSWDNIQIVNSANVIQTTLTTTGLGIGTSTPGSLLSLQGIANFGTATSTFYGSGGLNLTGGGCFAVNGTCISGGGGGSGTVASGGQGQFPFYNATGTALTATSSLFIDQTGKVTISKASNPGLQIGDGATGYLKLGDSSILKANGTYYTFDSGLNIGGNSLTFGTPGTDTYSIITDSYLKFRSTAGAEWARFTTNGNLGLGTSSPASPLHIYRANNNGSQTEMLTMNVQDTGTTRMGYFKFAVGAAANRGGKIIFGENNGGFGESGLDFDLNKTTIYQFGTNPIALKTNSIDRLTVLGDGKVGIGTTTPTTALQVVGDIKTDTLNTLTVGIGSGNLSSNLVVGNGAFAANTTGDSNTAIGYQSLKSNTIGFQNTAIGFGTLLNNVSGSYNIAIGSYSLANTTAGSNIAMGVNALNANVSGDNNLAVGVNSLMNSTSYGNVAYGPSAGASLINGNSNVFVGRDSGNNGLQKTDASNSIAIGFGAYTTANNQAVIGNTSIAQTILNGNIGVGTTTPAAKIHAVSTTEQLRLGYNSTNYISSTVNSSGTMSLDAVGSTPAFTFLDQLNIGTGATTPFLLWGDSVKMRGESGNFGVYPLFTAKKFIFYDTGSVARTVVNMDTGAIGIGTSSPSSAFGLAVASSSLFHGALTQDVVATSTFAGGINITSGCFAVNGTCLNNPVVYNDSSAQMATGWVKNSGFVYLQNSSDLVGIRSLSPNSTLHVNGSIASGYRAATATTTLDINDSIVETTSGTYTVNLPTAVGIPGREYTIDNSGAGVITVDANGSQTIQGALTYTLLTDDSITIYSNGAKWRLK